MDWLTDVLPLLLLGVLQLAIAFGSGTYLLRTRRERGDQS